MHYNIGICAMSSGQKELAEISMNKALRYNPRYVKALVKRGDILMEQGYYEEAMKDYSDASSFNLKNKIRVKLRG